MGTEEELRAVAAEADGDLVEPFVGDAGDPDAMGRAVTHCQERFGGLDAVIAAAGVIAGGVPLWDMPPEQEDAVFDGTLRPAIVAARVAIPAMLRRPAPRDGRYVAISSAAATRGLPFLAAYCAAKAGVNGLVRALAVELRGTGITANAISPGSTRTRILDESARLYALEAAESFAAQQPLERLITPEEVAAMVVWLTGGASGAITGTAIAVDGGLAL
jgi:SDR family mycofactocin-dependent oxidoreductase